MACNEVQSNCQPCKDCPPQTPPVLPRCDVILDDGVFSHATVYVENGCIVAVMSGAPFVYAPEANCGETGGGGGRDGLDGDPGPPGAAATVDVGTVSMVGWEQPLRIWNTGTTAAAILNFEIPAQKPLDPDDSTNGITDNTAGINITNGLIQDIPATWPPVLYLMSSTGADDSGITIEFTKDENTGVVTAVIDSSVLAADFQSAINDLIVRIEELEDNRPFMNPWELATDDYLPNEDHQNTFPYPIQVKMFMQRKGTASQPSPTFSRLAIAINGTHHSESWASSGCTAASGTGPNFPGYDAYLTATIPPGSTFRWSGPNILDPFNSYSLYALR